MIKKVKYNIFFLIENSLKGNIIVRLGNNGNKKRKVAQEKEVEKQANTECATEQSKKNLSKFNNKVQYIVYILCMI